MDTKGTDEKYAKYKEHQVSLDNSYLDVFSGKNGETVLEDLRRFCGFDESCFGKDNNETNKLLGSRVVFLYIQDRLSRRFSKAIEEKKL